MKIKIVLSTLLAFVSGAAVASPLMLGNAGNYRQQVHELKEHFSEMESVPNQQQFHVVGTIRVFPRDTERLPVYRGNNETSSFPVPPSCLVFADSWDQPMLTIVVCKEGHSDGRIVSFRYPH